MSLMDDGGFRWGLEGQAGLPIPEDGLLLPCFHGFASRREVEELLQGKALGSFLLRLSESQAGIILSYSGTDRCRHFIIEQLPENRYRILGDQRLHNSIPELLEFYKTAPILPFIEYLTTACNKVPDKHYEDIDRIRRWKMSPREAGGGGIAAGDVPNVPEDGAGLAGSPGTPPFDPKATLGAHPQAEEGSAKVTQEEATYQEVPDKHYVDIDRIRRQKMKSREAGGGGIAAGDIPNVPEDGAGLTPSPGAPPFDPKAMLDARPWAEEGSAKVAQEEATYQELPDKHYEDIDRIRRRKMNSRKAGGGGITTGDIPNVPEDGAGLTLSPGAPPFDPRTELPDKHYEDIDSIRRRKMKSREAGGGGIDTGDVPNVPEDGAGLTRSPGTPPFDPKATLDAHPRAEEGSAKVAQEEPTYQELPDKHYEDIDRIRRRKMNSRKAGGGGITTGDIPNVPEDGAGLTPSPGAPPFAPRTELPDKHYEDIDSIRRRKMKSREAGGGGIDTGDVPNVPEDGAGLTRSPGTPPFDPKATLDAHPRAEEGSAKVAQEEPTYQEVPDKHYVDIDRIRRWMVKSCEAGGGGITTRDIPNVPEDGAGLTPSLEGPPFDPRSEVLDKHYEDIDRIRRRKMKSREAGGGGITDREIPNVPEDGAGLTLSPGAPPFDPRTEVLDKHYEDIDRIRRRKMNSREASGGGITAGDIPNVPEDGAGLTLSPGAPPFDPRTEVLDKHYEDIDRIRRRKMNSREAGGGGITDREIPNVPEDGAGLTLSPGAPPFDPRTEVLDKHYEDIDRIRRRKMNSREASGGGITAGDIPNVPEDGAGLTLSPGAPPFDPRTEVPDKHYEDIDRIRRRKMKSREAGGGGITAGDIPNMPEDGAGLTPSPGAPPFDPRTEVLDKHYVDIDRIRRWMVKSCEAGGGGITTRDIPNVPEDGAGLTPSLEGPPFDPRTEVLDKHYEDIDRIRRRKMKTREAGGGGITSGDIPNVPEDGAGLTLSPGAPPFDPKATLDVRLQSMEGSAKVTAEEATYQEIPEGRTLVRNSSNKDLSSCSTEKRTYTKVKKRHIYTEPGPRPHGRLERTHTYAEPSQGPLYADPNDEIVLYAAPQGLPPRALGGHHHVYSEPDPKIAGRGNLYCPAPTKSSAVTPDLPPRQPADNPQGEVMPSTPPRWPSSPPLVPPSVQPTYAQPARRGSQATRGLAGDGFELDNLDYGILPRPAARPGPEGRPGPEARPILTPRPGPEMRPLPVPRPGLVPVSCSEMRPVPEPKPETELRTGPETRPVPEMRPKTVLEGRPIPTPRPDPNLRPVPKPDPNQRPVPRPDSNPRPDSTSRPVPRPDSTPRPVPRPDSTPRPVPRPDSTPSLVPRPDSTSRPVPRPDSTPSPVPRPDSTPSPAPWPDSIPRPVPRPDSTPSPAPRPDSTPSPAPWPDSIPRPVPRPDSTPSPAPRPDSTPSPAPWPDSIPRPVPRPDSTPSPAPRPDSTPRPAPRPDSTPRPVPRPDPTPRPVPEARPAPMPRPNHTIPGPALIQPENLYEQVPEEYLRPPPFAPSRPIYRRDP